MEPEIHSFMESFFQEDIWKSLELTPEERLFDYYMSNAAICGYPLAYMQLTKHQNVLHKIYNLIKSLEERNSKLISDLKTYWIFLFANYGVYFLREFQNNKKTPSDLNLDFDRKTLEDAGLKLDEDDWRYIFDKDYYPTRKVKESIEESGSNFYGEGITTEMFNRDIPPEERSLNSYYELKDGKVVDNPYRIGGKGSEYLERCSYWIDKAYNVAFENPEYFDDATVKSLNLLLKFLKSGKEEDFKAHSKEWLKMNNRVEYTFGFIEPYDDQFGQIGTFQADVTMKSRNFQALLEKLPSFEEKFPLPNEWKREDMSVLPNAAEAHKIISTGGLGPMLFVLAYCLPNYTDLRSEYSSKQVIYSALPIQHVEKHMQVYFSKEDQEFFRKYSPDLKITEVVRSATVTLHETIGHASGNSWYRDYENDEVYSKMNKEVENGNYKDYRILDNYNGPKVSAEMRNNLTSYGNNLEELRAEVVALFTFLKHFDEIYSTGFLGEWNKEITYEKFCKLAIYDIAGAHKRWGGCCKEDSTVVNGAHGTANTAIMFYLIENTEGIIELEKDNVEIGREIMSVLRLYVDETKMHVILNSVERLMVKIQRFSSTLPVNEINKFFETYGISCKDPEYPGIVKRMKSVAQNGIKAHIQTFPVWNELKEGDKVVNVVPSYPKNVFTCYESIYRMAYDIQN